MVDEGDYDYLYEKYPEIFDKILKESSEQQKKLLQEEQIQ